MNNEEYIIEAVYDELRITPEGGDATPLLAALAGLLLADDPEPPTVLETGMGTMVNAQHDDWEDRDILRRQALGALAAKGVALDA